MAEISIANISKSFAGTIILEGVSLDVANGEFLTLVGPSGCGKSTLLRIIAGLEHQDSGTIAIAGSSVDMKAPKARDLSMVFQSYALYPYMTVEENISLPLTMRRMGTLQRLPLLGGLLPGAGAIRREIAVEARQVAESLGIAHLLSRRPGQLSGGQRQRVALARAMVRQPQAFLMDEPLSNLDAKMRVKARAEISEMHRRLQATFIYVTHDQIEAMTMSDRVAVMMHGRLLQVDPPQRIYDEPKTLEVARFIGTPEINVLPGTVRHDGAIEVFDKIWPVVVDAGRHAPVSVAVRPEVWEVAQQPGEGSLLTGTVRHIELLGSETLLHVSFAGSAASVVARVEPTVATRYRLGSPIHLAVDPARILVFTENGKRAATLTRSVPSQVRNLHG
ncbi:ABC transporter ATP-binding protein [Rhizobium terrae]|uniref:ABC transporter ATP-binding protein n=1 Tax=Rhizobium terrae TaxID=2171756 RepID=UPI000E3E83D2|nr:ABC transporter ATP-binding protein [Rhizobium terrae]